MLYRKMRWIICLLILFSFDAQASNQNVYVSESLKTANPYLSYILKRDYTDATELAFLDYSKALNTNVTAPNYLFSEKPADIIVSELIKKEANVIIGYAFSNNSALASAALEQSSSILITPTASSNRMFNNQKVISLGVSVDNVTKVICSKVESQSTLMIYPKNVFYAAEHVESINKKCGDKISKAIPYFSSEINLNELVSVVFEDVNKYRTIILPGYVHEAIPFLEKLKEKNWKGHIIGTSQWGYSVEIIRDGLGFVPYKISIATDYVRNLGSDQVKRFIASFESKYKRKPNQFAAAVYDAVSFVLSRLHQCKTNRVSMCLRSESTYKGVSGEFGFKNNRYWTKFYFADWSGKDFVIKDAFSTDL